MPHFTHTLTRYLKSHPKNFEKMVFVAGPRQVGKTTMIQQWPKVFHDPRAYYLNWDVPEDRKILRQNDLAFFREKISPGKTQPFFLLDEIHKYPRWKGLLKGLYDTVKDQCKLAVTGSARLDVYRRGGDSLLGRYWLFHLFPITVAEALGNSQWNTLPERWPEENHPKIKTTFDHLFERGGFPEPFFKLNAAEYRRWSQLRREILVREDLRDLSRITELVSIEKLMELLPGKIGSPLSLNSLREDLEVSHPTLKNWLNWLKKLYYFFSVPVYSKNLARSLKKDEKIYLFDWAENQDPGARFENLVALHLFKAVHQHKEMMGEDLSLHYLRDKEKREVDFLITKDKKPWMLVETKLSADPSPHALAYYAQRLNPKHVVLLTREWLKPRQKVYHSLSYWLSPAGTFFSEWV